MSLSALSPGYAACDAGLCSVCGWASPHRAQAHVGGRMTRGCGSCAGAPQRVEPAAVSLPGCGAGCGCCVCSGHGPPGNIGTPCLPGAPLSTCSTRTWVEVVSHLQRNTAGLSAPAFGLVSLAAGMPQEGTLCPFPRTPRCRLCTGDPVHLPWASRALCLHQMQLKITDVHDRSLAAKISGV